MSIELIDGPCKGAYLVKTAPVFLRAVIGPRGKMDVLDLAHDAPSVNEKIYVYVRDNPAGQIHLFSRGKGGKALTGWWATGQYRYLSAIDGETVRDNAKWVAWSEPQIAALQNKQMSSGGESV